ncbi:MAG: hypothetical protein QG671_2769 [Actinomycetota bacterium]|jgi:hypothetical protein|nr:hypothetical protein [Actinomycetota bacterium]
MGGKTQFTGWLDHGWGLQVNTANQLLKLIGHIALLKQDRTYAWRGQSDASHDFSSSLYRRLAKQHSVVTEDIVRDEELRILKEARRWGLGRDLGPSATDLHLLAVLQHHGVPTRLIDVTSNPMTALWFAIEEPSADLHLAAQRTPGVLFAVDVTPTDWYATFQHAEGQTFEHSVSPLGASYKQALEKSESKGHFFRAYPALPDERMKAQEGYFLGSHVPGRHKAPGVMGMNPIGARPGAEKLEKLVKASEGPGRPPTLPFCAIVIPPRVKDRLRDPLRRTYNRRRRVLFPDVEGFREAFDRDQLD